MYELSSKFRLPHEEPPDFGRKTWKVYTAAKVAGAVGLAGALLAGYFKDSEFRRFFFGYLVSYAFFLAIALGALFFVLIQHLVRAGWSVNVRRVAEAMAATLPVLGGLATPIIVSVVLHNGGLYPWALPSGAVSATHHAQGDRTLTPTLSKTTGRGSVVLVAGDAPHAEKGVEGKRTLDELTLKKRKWLNPWFFIFRIVVYFVIWSAIAMYFWHESTRQDADGDVQHTLNMQRLAAPCLLVLGITLTFAAFDLLMSLDPHWYSTIFGVYFFASAAVSFFAAVVVIVSLMQRAGFLKEAVTTEHFHDLGKFLFGFVFFWGYIAFSQYMLLWYANIPETAVWLARHGASTMKQAPTEEAAKILEMGKQWGPWALLLLFTHFLLPFAGLMSRHFKRNHKVLLFWSVWLLVAHYINMCWIVLPEMRIGFTFGVVDILVFIGLLGVLGAAWIRFAAHNKLRPVADPRVHESAVFVNV